MCIFPHKHTTIWHKILSSIFIITSIQLPNLNPLTPNSKHTNIGPKYISLYKINKILFSLIEHTTTFKYHKYQIK